MGTFPVPHGLVMFVSICKHLSSFNLSVFLPEPSKAVKVTLQFLSHSIAELVTGTSPALLEEQGRAVFYINTFWPRPVGVWFIERRNLAR